MLDQDVRFDRLELPGLANKRKSRAVAETILEAIQAGDLRPRARLPSERNLAEQLGVSRGAIREALSALQLAGAIQIRTGEGSFVSQPAATEESAHQAMSIIDQSDSPLELWESRRAFEFTLVEMASRAATDDHRRAVAERLDAMRVAASRRELKSYVAANDAFHGALVAPVTNSILREIAAKLIHATNQLVTREEVLSYLDENLSDSLRKHEAIREAYETRDIGALRRAIDHHFDELIRYYLGE